MPWAIQCIERTLGVKYKNAYQGQESKIRQNSVIKLEGTKSSKGDHSTEIPLESLSKISTQGSMLEKQI